MRSSNLDINCSVRQWSWSTAAPSFRGRSRHGRHAVPDRTFSESRLFARARIACAGVSSNFRSGCLKHFRFRESIPPVANQASQLYRARSGSIFNASRLQRSPHSSASASLYFNSTQFTEVCAESRARIENKRSKMIEKIGRETRPKKDGDVTKKIGRGRGGEGWGGGAKFVHLKTELLYAKSKQKNRQRRI